MKKDTQESAFRQRVLEYQRNGHSVTDTANRYHLSRKTVHKWRNRWDGAGSQGTAQGSKPRLRSSWSRGRQRSISGEISYWPTRMPESAGIAEASAVSRKQYGKYRVKSRGKSRRSERISHTSEQRIQVKRFRWM